MTCLSVLGGSLLIVIMRKLLLFVLQVCTKVCRVRFSSSVGLGLTQMDISVRLLEQMRRWLVLLSLCVVISSKLGGTLGMV